MTVRSWAYRGLVLLSALAAPPARAAEPGADGGETRTASAVVPEAAPPAPAAASGGAPAAPAPAAAAPGQTPRGPWPTKKALQEALGVKLDGRLFAGVAADEASGWARQLSLGSARLQVEAALPRADVVLEAELAGSPSLKDAFVRFVNDTREWRLQVGRFKAPFSERHLLSTWALPLVERGLVDDLVVGDEGFGGRRAGVMAQARSRRLAGLEAELAVVEGLPPPTGGAAAEDVAARAALRPTSWLTCGAAGYFAGALEAGRHAAGSVHLTLRARGLRGTVEAIAGRAAVGPFTAGTALATFDVPAGGWIVQPVLAGERIALGGGAGSGYSATAGVNVLLGRELKVMAQGVRSMRPGDARPGSRVALVLGTRF